MSQRAERWLFAGLLAVSALPAAMFEYFPSQDGPVHTANGAVIGGDGSPVIGEYFRVALSQGTNLLADLGLAGLLSFLSGPAADKTMALLLIIGLPLALRYCLRQLAPGAVWLSILGVPLGSGLFVYYGFYNFLLGLVLSLVAFGFWLGHTRSGRAGPVDWLIFSLLLALVYVSHPLPLLALLAMIVAAASDDVLNLEERSGFAGPLLRRIAPIGLLAVLPLALLLAFGASRGSEIMYSGSPLGRLVKLPSAPVLALSGFEFPFAVMPALAGLILAVSALRSEGVRRESLGFLIPLGLLVVGYFVVPNGIGEGTVIPSRVALYVILFGLFWLAGRERSRRAGIVALFLSAVAVAGLAAVRIPAQADLNADIEEYLSGRTVLEPDSTVLPVWGVEPDGAAGSRVTPRHTTGYLMATGDVADLHHFVGHLSISPVRFEEDKGMEDLTPPANRNALVLGPDLVDIAGYVHEGPGRIDYIWLWDRAAADPEAFDIPAVSDLFRVLNDEYELVFVSRSDGRLEVYARRGLG